MKLPTGTYLRDVFIKTELVNLAVWFCVL